MIFDFRFSIFDCARRRWAGRTLLVVCTLALFALSGCKGGKPAQATDDGAADANVIEKSAEKGPVRMVVRLSPKEPRLSDMVEMEVVVEAEQGVEVNPPPFGKAVGDFLVRDYTQKPAVTTDNKCVRRFLYQLEPAHAGRHLIRSITIEFTDKRADTEAKNEPVLLESEPIEIVVTSELGDKTPNLADLAPMHAPMPLPPSPVWRWLLVVLGLGAAVAGALIWRRRMRQNAAAGVVRRSPEETANAEMRGLLAENLHGKGEFKEFYVRLTAIVRRYIEATTGIRAPEQTTEEFLRDIRERQVFPSERAAQFAQFLEAADMVKYAAMQPGTRQVEEAIARAQEFVGLPSALTPLRKTCDE